jgi:cytochrome c556
MAPKNFSMWKTLFLIPIVCFFALSGADAQDDEMVIQYRQKVMAGHANNMGSIGDVMKNKLPQAATQISLHAEILAKYADLIEGAFEKNVSAGATDAKPEIWQNWEDFLAKAKALGEASTELSKVAEGGDLKAAMSQVRAVGATCSGCHNDYRKPQ